jgi:hypothetical protein
MCVPRGRHRAKSQPASHNVGPTSTGDRWITRRDTGAYDPTGPTSSTKTVQMTDDEGSSDAAHLSDIPLFGSCTAEQLDRLAELGNTRILNDADIVVHEGDKGGTFFVITRGHARVSRDGRVVDTLGPGDYFGELSLLDPASRDAGTRRDTGLPRLAPDGHGTQVA